MRDVRKLVARLNPATARFDIGRGGIPELTPQDIAAALAFVPSGLGRELFMRLWWPDGAKLSESALAESFACAVRAEFARRHRALQVAVLDLHIASEDQSTRATRSDAAERELMRLQAAVASAKAQAWPHNPEMHVRIRRAVIDELSRPNHCGKCGGLGEVMDGSLRKTCDGCAGKGVVPVSDRSRAERIGRDESSYRSTWRPMYEWAYALARDLELEAARALGRALNECSTRVDVA